MNGGNTISKAQRPQYVLAKVTKPKVVRNKLLCPLIAIPDTMGMEATICYHLLKNGYSMDEVRGLRHLPRDWTATTIIGRIDYYGEAEYPEGWYRH